MHETGRREIIGLDVGEAETEAFWREFLRPLVARGLVGVELAISDAHPGLKAALAQVLGAPWQRCTVHFLRDCPGTCRATSTSAGRDHPPDLHRRGRRRRPAIGCVDAVEQLERRLPKVAALLEDAEPDVLAFYAFPAEHWPKIRSTDESVKGSRAVRRWFSGSDRSGAVLAGAQIGFCGPVSGWAARIGVDFGHAAASPSVAARVGAAVSGR